MGNISSQYIVFPHALYRQLLSIMNYSNEYDKEKISKAIDTFNETLVFLKKKVEHMNTNMEKYIKEAQRLYLLNNKQGALHQIKLKKMYEKEIRKIESIQFNIESNILHMESVSVMLETVSTLKNTSSHIQLIHKNLDIGKVEDLIENLCDQKDTSSSIETILTENSITDFSDEELLQELENYKDDDNNSTNTDITLLNSKKHVITDESNLKQTNLNNSICNEQFPDVPTNNIELSNTNTNNIELSNTNNIELSNTNKIELSNTNNIELSNKKVIINNKN